jgi:hypothetical protein
MAVAPRRSRLGHETVGDVHEARQPPLPLARSGQQAGSCRSVDCGLGRRLRARNGTPGRPASPDAYGGLATVSRTAESSTACNVCRAWGTIRRSPSRPSHSAASATRRTRPPSTWRVASPGFSCSDSADPRSTRSASAAAHVHVHRRPSRRRGRPERSLPTSSVRGRAPQARTSPYRQRGHPAARPSTTGTVRAGSDLRCGQLHALPPTRSTPRRLEGTSGLLLPTGHAEGGASGLAGPRPERRRRLGRHHLGRHHLAYQAAGHGSSPNSAPARRTWMAYTRQSARGGP